MKRHRDIYFARDRGNSPTSIIITTLAAQAYEPVGDLFSVLHQVLENMPNFVERKSGRCVIANPVQQKENFADRWIRHPMRAQRFFEWLDAALQDFTAIADAQETDEALTRTAKVLGTAPAEAARRATVTDRHEKRRTTVATSVPAGRDRFA